MSNWGMGPYGATMDLSSAFQGPEGLFRPGKGYKADTVTLDQDTISRIAVATNGNVQIQQFVTRGGVSTAYRLHCKRCGGQLRIDEYEKLVTLRDREHELSAFFQDHRHDGNPVPPALNPLPVADLTANAGRKIRSDE